MKSMQASSSHRVFTFGSHSHYFLFRSHQKCLLYPSSVSKDRIPVVYPAQNMIEKTGFEQVLDRIDQWSRASYRTSYAKRATTSEQCMGDLLCRVLRSKLCVCDNERPRVSANVEVHPTGGLSGLTDRRWAPRNGPKVPVRFTTHSTHCLFRGSPRTHAFHMSLRCSRPNTRRWIHRSGSRRYRSCKDALRSCQQLSRNKRCNRMIEMSTMKIIYADWGHNFLCINSKQLTCNNFFSIFS